MKIEEEIIFLTKEINRLNNKSDVVEDLELQRDMLVDILSDISGVSIEDILKWANAQ